MKTVEAAHAALTNGEALPIRHVLVMAAGSTTDTAIGTKRGSRKLLVLVLSDSTKLIIVRLEDYLAWVEPWSVIFAKIILVKRIIIFYSLLLSLFLFLLPLVPINPRPLKRVVRRFLLNLIPTSLVINKLLL